MAESTVAINRAELFFISNYPGRSHDGFLAIGTNDGARLFFWARDTEIDNNKRFGRTTTAFGDEWHHYVGVRDAANNELRFYVDGSRKATAAFPGEVPIRDSDSSLGLIQHFGNRHLEGDIDDIRFYGRALSDGEVAELFNIGQN